MENECKCLRKRAHESDKHPGSLKGNKARIQQHTILLDFLVKAFLLGGVLKIVLLSRASLGTDTDPDDLGVRALR